MVADKRIGWVSAISTPIVTELAENNMLSPLRRILHQYGKNWVLTLGDNLLGLHLDFRKEAVESIKELSYSSTPPAFILNAAVGLNNLLEPILENTFINDNAYDYWLKMETPKHSQERDKDRNRDDFDFDR